MGLQMSNVELADALDMRRGVGRCVWKDAAIVCETRSVV